MIQPLRSLLYPTMNPPTRRSYRVDIFNNLMADNIMVYEVMRPYDLVPWCFVVHNYEDHLQFFHALWNMDEFTGCAADRHFLMRLWYHICARHGPYRPEDLDISLDESDEPVVYRTAARSIITRHLTDTLDLFEVSKDHEEEDRIKECIDRFCRCILI